MTFRTHPWPKSGHNDRFRSALHVSSQNGLPSSPPRNAQRLRVSIGMLEASDKRHQSNGVFTAENAIYSLQMAFLDPKMPFVRCLVQDAFLT